MHAAIKYGGCDSDRLVTIDAPIANPDIENYFINRCFTRTRGLRVDPLLISGIGLQMARFSGQASQVISQMEEHIPFLKSAQKVCCPSL
jgi:hypothetical protein